MLDVDDRRTAPEQPIDRRHVVMCDKRENTAGTKQPPARFSKLFRRGDVFERLKAADEIKALRSELLFCEDPLADKWADLRFGRLDGRFGRFDANYVGEARSAQPFQE